ncbi:MAG: glycoside hydrolase family 9 protein [Halorhabdus sp.]
MDVYVNQLGYEPSGSKQVVIEAGEEWELDGVELVDADVGDHVASLTPECHGTVADWDCGDFWTVAFDDVTREGEYYLLVDPDDGRTVASRRFEIRSNLHQRELLSDLLRGIVAQRSRGVYDRVDRQAPFVGERDGTVDVHGGWYDASADRSKYLSHLSYANFWNMQQSPLVVWALLDARARLLEHDIETDLDAHLIEEALYGADFLVRMHDPAGYFYSTVFDGWSHDPDRREICAFEGRAGRKTDDYEAGYRQGGGVAIAALARASRLDGDAYNGAAFDGETYREHAIEGFDHLEATNDAYLDDGTENVIDEYCALLAASELSAAVGEDRFREAAHERAQALCDRQTADDRYEGWFRADDAERPYFNVVEAGLPAIALLRYRSLVEAPIDGIERTLADYWTFEREITTEVTNPFGYARQYVVDADGDRRSSFFIPQDNETGYWWLGENSRLASLAAAARQSADVIETVDATVGAAWLRRFAREQIDWILGVNPYGAAMVRGVGRPLPEYDSAHPGVPGGVCNGITAGVRDPDGIAFAPDPQASDPQEAWRWTEQWVPHAAWLLLAVASVDRI